MPTVGLETADTGVAGGRVIHDKMSARGNECRQDCSKTRLTARSTRAVHYAGPYRHGRHPWAETIQMLPRRFRPKTDLHMLDKLHLPYLSSACAITIRKRYLASSA